MDPAGTAPGTTESTWQVGDVRVGRVEESLTELPPHVILPDVDTDTLASHADWLMPRWFTDDGRLRLSVHTFVVESQGVTIVVDTCVGPESERLPGDPAFPSRLADAVDGGLDAVDIVLCTHLHFDHVGWNTTPVDGVRVPTFPSARYLFARAELEALEVDDHMQVREPSVQPLLDAGVVDIVDPGHAITSEVALVSTPGHSPGHVSVLIESGDATALITGDAFHTPLQVARPDLAASAFDLDPVLSSATRAQLVDTYANTAAILLGTHFAPPSGGRVRRDGDRVWFEA